MKFQELTDKQWNVIKQYVPTRAKTGRPRDENKRSSNGTGYDVFKRITGIEIKP